MARIASFANLGCLVTGASSGIGHEIALQLAAHGARLVVTARRQDRLASLATACRAAGAKEVHVVVGDLAKTDDAARVFDDSAAALGHVDILINNAGFSVPGLFARSPLDRTQDMIEVNVRAATALCRLALPGMLQRNAGGVLNVASVAGFQCAPYQAGYGGSKAYLLHWSNAVHQELKQTGVAVTALCPGVTDTEFFEAAGYRKLTGFLKWRMPADRVARIGLKALAKGRMEVVPGFTNKALIFSQRFVPRTWAAALSRRLMGGRPWPVRDSAPHQDRAPNQDRAAVQDPAPDRDRAADRPDDGTPG